MCQTLLVIPRQIAGIDVFGFGWLLGVWLIASILLLAWSVRRHGWGSETRGYASLLAVVGVAIAFVLPAISDPQGLAIRGFGVMMLLSIVAASLLTLYRGAQRGVDQEMLLNMGTWLFVSGIIGARLFYVIEYWRQFQKPTIGETLAAILNFPQGGMVVYGALLAGGLALIVFVYKNHLPGLALTDLVAPGVVLGVGLGRLGCFLNGCCYGGLTDLPWAVQFPPTSPAYIDQAQRGALFVHGLIFTGGGTDPAIIQRVEPGSAADRVGLAAGQRVTSVNGVRVGSVEEAQAELLRISGEEAPISIHLAGDPQVKNWRITGSPPRSLPVHPAQLYSLIDALLLLLLVLAYEPYKKRDGELTALVLTIHPISRFLLEIIRVDEAAVFNTGLSISQNISIAIFVGGVALWIYLLWRRPVGRAWPARLAVAG
jgi:phosphatidylglycerol---prolipoprotein diacylglyceryl transferase